MDSIRHAGEAMMCINSKTGKHPAGDAGERENLERAIERLKKRSWCDDATIALAAAEKWLATLPSPERWGVFVDGERHPWAEWPTEKAAIADATRILECGRTVAVRKCS